MNYELDTQAAERERERVKKSITKKDLLSI